MKSSRMTSWANAEPPGVPRRERDLAIVVFRAVVKAHGARDFMMLAGVIERGHGVHAAA